jgi:ribonuclease BN (tRNA processing enzyme)
MTVFTRRAWIGAACSAFALAGVAGASAPTDRLVLLGTMGGPTPSARRAMTSQLLVIAGAHYLVDCGPGTITRLAAAQVAANALDAIFVTHLHDDHIGDLGALLVIAWTMGLARPIDVYGPPPIARTVALLLQAFAPDIDARRREIARPAPADLIRVHELSDDGVFLRDDGVSVAAARVDHGEMAPAFGFRFESSERTVAFSGDTRAVPALRHLTADADLFVAEAMYLPAVERRLRNQPGAVQFEALLRRIHMTAEEAGLVAAQAHVRTLVLSHLVPGDDVAITDAQWRAAAHTHFQGRVVVGHDLLTL